MKLQGSCKGVSERSLKALQGVLNEFSDVSEAFGMLPGGLEGVSKV